MLGLKTIGSLTVAPTRSGDYDQIAKIVLSTSASSITFTNIPSYYRNLELFFTGRCNYSGLTESMLFRINGDTSSNYDYQSHFGRSSSSTAEEIYGYSAGILTDYLIGNTAGANMATSCRAMFFDYNNKISEKSVLAESGSNWNQSTTNNHIIFHSLSCWRSTSAITSISIFPITSQFMTSTIAAIYGIRGGN